MFVSIFIFGKFFESVNSVNVVFALHHIVFFVAFIRFGIRYLGIFILSIQFDVETTYLGTHVEKGEWS